MGDPFRKRERLGNATRPIRESGPTHACPEAACYTEYTAKQRSNKMNSCKQVVKNSSAQAPPPVFFNKAEGSAPRVPFTAFFFKITYIGPFFVKKKQSRRAARVS